VREVVLAALRAFCWRPRACPPFLAAALRFDDDERELADRELEERLLPDERLPDERLEPLDFFLPPEPPLPRRSAMCRSPS